MGVGRKLDPLRDLEQTLLRAGPLGAQGQHNGRVVLQRQVEPGHHGDEEELFAGQVAADAPCAQHVVELFGQAGDLGVVGGAGAAGRVDVDDADPDLAQQLLQRGRELGIGRARLQVGDWLVVVAAVVQVHAEHAVIGVAAGGGQVGADAAGQRVDEEGRRLAKEQLLGGAQPVFATLDGHAQVFAMREGMEDAAEDVEDARVFDHVGVDEMVPAHAAVGAIGPAVYGGGEEAPVAGVIAEAGQQVVGQAGEIAAAVRVSERLVAVLDAELPCLLQKRGQLDRVQAEQQLGSAGDGRGKLSKHGFLRFARG